MIKYDILTIFPEMFSALNESILKRAQENRFIEINTIDIRDFSDNKHKKVDDYPYGGGNGMVMTPQPIYNAYKSIRKNCDYKPKTIYLSPQGRVLTHDVAFELSKMNILSYCGHYEGIDERIIEEIVDEEISIGDYVLTGGELAAMVLIDCLSRFVQGVLSNENSCLEESFCNGLLEYPQYTRPYIFNGKKVPEVLLSGHHKNIETWRHKQSLLRTKNKRPDYFLKLPNSILNDGDKKNL